MKSTKVFFIALIILLVAVGSGMVFIIQAAAETEGKYTYSVIDGKATIDKYNGSETEIVIPSKIKNYPVTAIGEHAFYSNKYINSIKISNSVKTIGPGAFALCEQLKNIKLPNSLMSIEKETFMGCKNIKTLKFPSSVKEVGDRAFSGCINFSMVNLPNKLIILGEQVFNGCGMMDILLPASLKSIGAGAFDGCAGLVAIRVDKANSAFTTRDGVLFDKACKTLLAYPGGKLGFSYEVPPGVEFIGEKAFYNRMLWFVTLPEGVKAIGAEAFASLAPGVAVRIADSVESIGKNGFMHVDFLTGTKAVMAKEIAQLPGIQFYPDDMTADELLSGYVQGRDSLERLLKCWVLQPDAAGMYEEIRSAIADNGESKLTEFEQFCADLYALAKLQAIKPGGAPAYMYINRIYDRHDNMQDLALRLTGLPISQQLMDKLAQTKAQPKSDPVLWSNKALKTCLGKGSNFVPENPQKNTCLLILSEESRVAIEDKSVAAISQPSLPMEQADTAIKIITSPTSIGFTGNPNMASIMIYLRVSYPYAGRYGYYGIPTFKAYHCKAEFTAYGINGNKRTQIAKVTIANYQGDVIYGWKFWADFPIPGSSHEWKKFIENIDKWGETHY